MATRDNATLVIGPVSSGEAMAAAPVAVNLQIPLFTTATTPEVLRAGPWVFKISEVAEQYMLPLARHVAERGEADGERDAHRLALLVDEALLLHHRARLLRHRYGARQVGLG
jgi:ABC-type branched-subunit amino acid transport system substrate-binding protein